MVAVARKGEAPIAEVAKDFGISESCLRKWLHVADVEDGRRPGTTARIATQTYPSGRSVTTSYSSARQVASVTASSSGPLPAIRTK